MESPVYEGGIILDFHLQIDGRHPDYKRFERNGYAIYKGEKILLGMHTHVPEINGTVMIFLDNEGQSWKMSDGFLMGYFNDGHIGFTPGDERIVMEFSDGRLMSYMRSTCGRIVKIYSSDGIQFWTKVEPTDLAMSNSSCALVRIPSSTDLVLIWNLGNCGDIEAGYRRGRSLATMENPERIPKCLNGSRGSAKMSVSNRRL